MNNNLGKRGPATNPDDMVQLQQRLDAAYALVQLHQQQVVDANALAQQEQNQRQQQQQQLQEVTEERDALRQQLQQQQQVTEERDALRQQLQQQEQQLQAANNTNAEQLGLINNLTMEKDTLTRQLHQQQQELQQLQQQFQQLQQQQQKQLQQLQQQQEEEQQQLRQELEEARTEINRLQSIDNYRSPPVTPDRGVTSYYDPNFTQSMDYVAATHPRDDAAKQVSLELMKNVVIGTQNDLKSINEEYKKEDEEVALVPGRVFTVTKDYREEESRKSLMYSILKANGLVKKLFSLENESIVVEECCGIAGSVSISQVCKTSLELAAVIADSDSFDEIVPIKPTTMLDKNLRKFITTCREKVDLISKRDNLTDPNVIGAFLELSRFLGYLKQKRKELINSRKRDYTPEINLINDTIILITDTLSLKSPLDVAQTAVLLGITKCSLVNSIQFTSEDYVASVGGARFLPSLTQTAVPAHDIKTGQTCTLSTKLLRGPAWVAFLVLIPKMFAPSLQNEMNAASGKAAGLKDTFMYEFLNYRSDPRCIKVYTVLTEENDAFTYQNIKNQNFFDRCCEGTSKFELLAKKLDKKVNHPNTNNECTVYDLLIELGKDSKQFSGDIYIELYRQAAFFGFCYQKSRRFLTSEILTRGMRDFLCHDFDKLIISLMLLTYDFKRIIQEWGYKKYQTENPNLSSAMQTESASSSSASSSSSSSPSNPSFFDRVNNVTTRTNPEGFSQFLEYHDTEENWSDILKTGELEWTSVLNDTEVEEIFSDILKTCNKPFNNSWSDIKSGSKTLPGKTASSDKSKKELVRAEYENFCTPKGGEFIDPLLVEQMFGYRPISPGSQQKLFDGIQTMIEIQSTFNAHVYEEHLPGFSDIVTFVGYEQMAVDNSSSSSSSSGMGRKLINRGEGRALFCRGNFFSDSSKHEGRVANISIITGLERNYNILIRDVPASVGVVANVTDLNFSKAGDPDISLVGCIGVADAASNRIKKEFGYHEVIQGGKEKLFLDRRNVAVCVLEQFEEPTNDEQPSFIFGPCNFLVQSNYYKVSQANSKNALDELIRRLNEEIIPELIKGLDIEFNIRFNLPIDSINYVNVTGGGGSATMSEVLQEQDRERESFKLVMEGTFMCFQAFKQELSNISQRQTTSMSSISFKENVGKAASTLANNLNTIYTNLQKNTLKRKEVWVFSKCVTSALDDIINFLTDTEKLFKQQKVVKTLRKKRIEEEEMDENANGGGGAIEDSSVSLQSVEPNSSQVTTSPFITENELQPLSTKTQDPISITNPVETGYGLTENNDVTNYNKSTTDIVSSVTTPIENNNLPKSMVKIYKTINSRGEILFDVAIELFGDGIYGGYLGVSNGKSFLKIFTSPQEVNEYITENIPDLQEQNNLITNIPEKTPEEALEKSPEIPTEKQPVITHEKPQEEASGILSYLGLGGQNKTRSNRNKNKSRKMRKTIRQNKKSNKGSKKHKKVIKHKRSRSNN
jgi:hypothetical protein